ncbi:MAG: 4-(cytidine 5'-diphospho)-2-C-methyl-D-erythritol kinase [Lachnospiraceae bacterium]|nr:4-(cytidine 5'-diphospho)-2-C-methyl-D-erythritol kinase [Lachnospiraceae bacterium]
MPIYKKAYAKINLSLDVKGKLENGYHEVCMIMQTVGLFDELSFDMFDCGGEERIKLETGKITITENLKDNLIYRASQLLLPKFPEGKGVTIKLVKNIPMSAGMAGGSTDAAAAFHGINELFELGLSDEELCGLGVKIGADVPYCIMGGTMLAEGIGEKLTRLPLLKGLNLVIAKPGAGVSTKYVYETLDAMENPIHPDVAAMVDVIKKTAALGRGSGEDKSEKNCADKNGTDKCRAEELSNGYKEISSLLGNILETVTIPACPDVEILKKQLIKYGAEGSLMSGSGPTVFGIFRDAETARTAALNMKNDPRCPAKDIFVTETI